MDIPKVCLSFSPNWFQPQIVTCSQDLLFYGANDSLFIYNFKLKRFYANIGIGIKITAVQVVKNLLYICLEGGNINVYDLMLAPIKYLYKLELNMEKIIYLIPQKNDYFLVFDERGVGVSMQLDGNKMKNFQIKVMNQPQDRVKFVLPFQNEKVFVFFEKGRILLSPNSPLEYAFKILYADVIDDTLVLLNKKNNNISLHIIKFKNDEDLFLKLSKWVLNDSKIQIVPEEIISEDERFYRIKMLMNDKLPVIDKACLSLKLINASSLILTSRQGEYYILSWNESTIKSQEITLHPKALELPQNNLLNSVSAIKSPIEAHYKMVYILNDIGRGQDRLFYSVGTDRRICFFRIQENGDLELHWKLILLSSRVTKISSCLTEKNLVFFSGPELSLRSLDLYKKHDSCYVNEFWRGIPSFQDFLPHPDQEGVIAFITTDNKLSICDIYKETSICQFELKEPMSQLFWCQDIQDILVLIDLIQSSYKIQRSNHQQYPVIVTDKKHLKKEYNLNYLVVVKGSAKITIISLKTFQTIYEDSILNTFALKDIINSKFGILPDLVTVKTALFNFFRNQKLIHINLVYNQNFLVNLLYYTETKKLHVDIISSHSQITCLSHLYDNSGNIFVVYGGMDRNVTVFNIVENKLYQIGHLKHRQPIHKVKIDKSYSILAIAKQSQSVQIWNIKQSIQYFMSKKIDSSREEINKIDASYNIRGHNGFIIDAEFDILNQLQVITCSDDQTLKVWDLSTIQNTKPPNKKKNKNKNKQQKKVKLNTGQAKQIYNESSSDEE